MLRRFAAVLLFTSLMSGTATAQPVEVESSEHAAAGTAFPARVGDFQRTRIVRFDPAGRDISATYEADLPGGRILASVYVYPAPPAAPDARQAMCRQHFEGVRQAVVRAYSGVRPVSAGAPLLIAGFDPNLSLRAEFEFETDFASGNETRRRPVQSDARLYCYVADAWLVKYRFTAPAEMAIDDAIEAFIRGGAWPGRTPPESVAMGPSPDRL